MPKLVAAAFGDAWAFVEDEGHLLLIRPPFKTTAAVSTNAITVERAVMKHGFTATDITFPDWKTLIEYLWSRLEEERRGTLSGESLQTGAVLRDAPITTVQRLLARVKDELIPRKEFQAAVKTLTSMLLNPRVRDDDAFYRRLVEMLDHCNEQISAITALRQSLTQVRWSEEFPGALTYDAEDAVEDYRHSIIRRGQLMMIGEH